MAETNILSDETNSSVDDIPVSQPSKLSESTINVINANCMKRSFQLYLSVVQEECKELCDVSLKKEHFKIKNFRSKSNRVRLACLYKFSPILKNLVKRCISRFFKNLPIEERLGFSKKTNICSASVGPGIDIVGYLGALCKYGVMLDASSTIKTINLSEQWNEMFHKLVSAAYKDYCRVFYGNPTDMHDNSIEFISSDIFEATMPPEAEREIKKCDILLMVKLFSGKKVTCLPLHTVLEKIFLLLKPGAVVFLIDGSEKKIRQIKDACFQSSDINVIHDPEEVVINSLSLEEYVLEKINIVPKKSCTAHFMVLQKKIIESDNKETFNLGRIIMEEKQVIKSKVKQSNFRKNKEVILHQLPPLVRYVPPHQRQAVNVAFNSRVARVQETVVEPTNGTAPFEKGYCQENNINEEKTKCVLLQTSSILTSSSCNNVLRQNNSDLHPGMQMLESCIGSHKAVSNENQNPANFDIEICGQNDSKREKIPTALLQKCSTPSRNFSGDEVLFLEMNGNFDPSWYTLSDNIGNDKPVLRENDNSSAFKTDYFNQNDSKEKILPSELQKCSAPGFSICSNAYLTSEKNINLHPEEHVLEAHVDNPKRVLRENENLIPMKSVFHGENEMNTEKQTEKVCFQNLTDEHVTYQSANSSKSCFEQYFDRKDKDVFYAVLQNWETRITTLETLITGISLDVSAMKDKLEFKSKCCCCEECGNCKKSSKLLQ